MISNISDRFKMLKLNSLFIIGSSILASNFITAPAQASLQGTLQRGQTQYVEVNLEPGQYLFYIIAVDAVTKDTPEASFSIYETNGKLIRKSALLPPELHLPRTKQGAAMVTSRARTVHFEIRMDSCKLVCGFAVVPMKLSSDRLGVVNLRSRILPNRQPNAASSPETSKNSRLQPSQPPHTTAGSEQQSGGQQYIFNTNSHINTNISVNPGDKVRVEASGRIRFGAFVGSGGPEGILISPTYNYFVDIPHGQLIARIRRFGAENLDGWFPIGEGGEFVAKSQGVLEFAVNDNRPRDNSGNFRIEVSISPSK